MTAHQTGKIVKVILIAGLLAGTTDIIAACVNAYIQNPGATPPKIFRYIASGVLGKEAFAGGAGTAALGLFLHYVIATLFAAFFVLLYANWKVLSRIWVIAGLLYGIVAWTIMSQVVVPLSHTPPLPPFRWDKAIIAILILMFFVGLPIAWVTQKYYPRKVSS